MSLPTLPTSEGDIVVPLPDQELINSRLKHLGKRRHQKLQPQAPVGLVVDPVELLRCISGSDSPIATHSTYTYSQPQHALDEVTTVTATTTHQKPIFSFPSSSEDRSSTPVSSHAHNVHEECAHDDSSRVVEHFEVDPHARSVLAFRRNSMRQMGQIDENETMEISSPKIGGENSDFTTPLFVISDGIRRTYFPGRPESKKQEEVREEMADHLAVFEKISNPTLLRKIQSHPELSSLGEPFPKPVKVNSDAPVAMSFFSNFAGELRSHVWTAAGENSGQQNTLAVCDNKTVEKSNKKTEKSAKSPNSSRSPSQSPSKVEVNNVKMPELSEGKPKKKSLMTSLMKWGTETHVKVSDKETNMFSPGSF